MANEKDLNINEKAKSDSKDSKEGKKLFNINDNPLFRRNIHQINNIVGRASLDLYGTDRNLDIERLNNKFQNILKDNITSINSKDSNDITSFISKVWSEDRKSTAFEDMISNQFNSEFGGDLSAMQSFFYDAYKNKLVEQNDLHQIASQLIELTEAILITRDAIISPDIVEGRMSRTLSFGNASDDEDSAISIVEKMEDRFKLLDKIKNFIIPKTLEYGEYYVYNIPYSKMFKDFMKVKDKSNIYKSYTYHEKVLTESFKDSDTKIYRNKNEYESYIKETYEKYSKSMSDYNEKQIMINPNYSFISEKEFSKKMTSIFENITISNDPIPLPFLDEGFSSMETYMKEYVSESGEYKVEKDTDWRHVDSDTRRTNEKRHDSQSTLFDRVASSSEGIKTDKDFEDIRDCYIKLLEPTHVIPIKIVDSPIGYYIVHEEDITPLTGAVGNSLYFSKIGDERSKHTIVDAIVDRIVAAFDKKFLKDNVKFKKEIADAISFYSINQKKLKFQFVPVEYMSVFKIDVDENGNGQSMLKKSLFYAKLYLLLLLFKIMSIILYSNDTRVNYIKTSGIDKNVANKIQEIARMKQNRQINLMDLFSYTTLINKVGAGSEMYVPVGRNDTRPMETEILSGQDIQLNTELMEMLKNSYILATGVPQAIMNYLGEAEFAKVVEQNNTKFNGRVVNYQLDFNPDITEMYKKLMRWSTNLSDSDIENFKFILQPPKTSAGNAKAEAIQSFQSIVEFLVSIYSGDPNQEEDPKATNKLINIFKRKFAADQLPMLNMDKIDEMWKEAEIEAIGEKIKPDPAKGTDDDDLGLEDFGPDGGLGNPPPM